MRKILNVVTTGLVEYLAALPKDDRIGRSYGDSK